VKATRAALGLRQQAVFKGVVAPPMVVAGAVLTDSSGRLIMLGTLGLLALIEVVTWRRMRHDPEPLIVPEGMATASVAMTLVRRLAGDVLMLAAFSCALLVAQEAVSAMFLGIIGLVFASGAIVHLRRARALERWERDRDMEVLEPGGLFSVEGLCAVPLASGR
jgi:hypothetical protein